MPRFMCLIPLLACVGCVAGLHKASHDSARPAVSEAARTFSGAASHADLAEFGERSAAEPSAAADLCPGRSAESPVPAGDANPETADTVRTPVQLASHGTTRSPDGIDHHRPLSINREGASVQASGHAAGQVESSPRVSVLKPVVPDRDAVERPAERGRPEPAGPSDAPEVIDANPRAVDLNLPTALSMVSGQHPVVGFAQVASSRGVRGTGRRPCSLVADDPSGIQLPSP